MVAPEIDKENIIEVSTSGNEPDIEVLQDLLLQAIGLQQAGRSVDASRLYRDILEAIPGQPNANHNLGVILLESQDYDACLPLFKAALEAAPEEQQYWMSYIEALIQAGEHEMASQVLRYGIDGGLHGDEVESYKTRLAEALSITPMHASTWQPGTGSEDAHTTDTSIAKAIPRKFTHSPKNTRQAPGQAEMNALVSLYSQGKYQDSEEAALVLTRRYPAHGFGWKVLGALLQQKGHIKDAFSALLKAADLLPQDAEAQYNLANAYYDEHQLNRAEHYYLKSLKLDVKFAKAHYNLGSVYKDQAEFARAEASYRKALALIPANAHLYFNLGQVLSGQGKVAEAETSFLNALEIDQGYVDAYYQLSQVYQKLDEPVKAEICLRKVIDLKPDFADAYFNLANRLLVRQQWDEVVTLYTTSIALNPNSLAAHNNLGKTYRDMGRFAEAEACFRSAISIDAGYASAYNNLGITLRDLGRLEEAKSWLLQGIALNPESSKAFNNLGLVLKELGQTQEAEAAYRHALLIAPDYAPAYCNLGILLKSQLRFEEAEASMRAAIKLQPDFAEAYNNLSLVFKEQGRLTEARDSVLAALEINPAYLDALSNMGTIFMDQGRVQEAESYFRKALEVNPDYDRAYSNLLFCMTHNEEVDAQSLAMQHALYGQRFETPLKANWALHTNSKEPERVLQIGIVSADFRNHPVAYFIEPVLEHLAKNPQLALHAFSNSMTEDDVTQRLRSHFHHWHQVTPLLDSGLDEYIRGCGIDILIDLSGHTSGHRLLAFARKPAPIQASWLGYLGSTGLTAMDYYLTDRWWMPPGQLDDQFTEKLLRLPVYAPFLPAETSPPVHALPAQKNGYLTFGSFNRISKLSRNVIQAWSALLRELPDSKLIIAAMPVNGDRGQLASWFAEEGIDAERIMFHARSTMEDYLALHGQVDIALDTFPYNGGTTTWHAVWMGVPTLTIAGDMPQGRISTSILEQVGLEQFVATNKADFIEKAIYWADMLPALAEVRASLRTRFSHSPAGQPAVIADGLHQAFRTVWQRWCQDEPAISFEVVA